MPSTMTFNQAAQLLNAIQQQATGQAALTATDLSEFVSAAQTTLRTGYDPVMHAISQVISRRWNASTSTAVRFCSARVRRDFPRRMQRSLRKTVR